MKRPKRRVLVPQGGCRPRDREIARSRCANLNPDRGGLPRTLQPSHLLTVLQPSYHFSDNHFRVALPTHHLQGGFYSAPLASSSPVRCFSLAYSYHKHPQILATHITERHVGLSHILQQSAPQALLYPTRETRGSRSNRECFSSISHHMSMLISSKGMRSGGVLKLKREKPCVSIE